ncbi:serine/threonine-protein kinase [Dictyobacter kobayashii]|uniref:non-specific serine/threonine protein kinase n=1 Tax=Dictyobacter kobayashii TaxID=2014872 RepID=A0A402ABC2_9CHLR|nr:serine/threonine-protein kinase [Dictyobacter kobayashii]GCE16305.1 hypothetical protein KDK_01050 [Dictyobacter kobayashii]
MKQEQQLSQQTGSASASSLDMLGRYRILCRLGRGGMGDVWLCEDPRLHRQVAIKTLPTHNQGDQEFVKHFEREAEAAASLSHPHILSVHDYGKQALPDGTVVTYIVMPYIHGGTFADRIAYYEQKQSLPPLLEMLSLLEQGAQAIDYIHKRHLIHRDIKPANMLLRDGNWLLLADFGIARILDNTDQQAQGSVAVGTPEYMAPEQAFGQATITSDNYSLAIIIYQLSTGRLPFQGETAIATMMQHQLQPPAPPRQFNPALPPAFERILLQGLEKGPKLRPALAVDFVAQLKQTLTDVAFQPTVLSTIRDLPALDFRESNTVTAANQEDEQRRRQRLTRRNLLWGLGGTVAAAVVAGAGLDIWEYVTHLPPAPLKLSPIKSISALPDQSGTDQPVLVLTGHNQAVHSLLWSHDNHSLLSGGLDAMTLWWDIAGLQQHPTRPYGQPFYSKQLVGKQFGLSPLYPTMSPDERQIAIFNTAIIQNKSTQITTYGADLRGPRPFEVPQAQNFFGAAWLRSNYLTGLSIEVDQKNRNNGSYKLYVIDPVQPQQQWKLALENGNLFQLNVPNLLLADPTKGSSLLAVQFGKQIVLGQVMVSEQTQWQASAHISVPMNMQCMAWTPDGQNILALYGDSNTNKWSLGLISRQNAFSSSLQKTVPLSSEINLPTVPGGNASSGTYNCLASSSQMVAAGTSAGDIYIWKLTGGSLSAAAPLKLKTSGIQASVQQLAWSPDGKWLAAGFNDQLSSILIWKL